MNFDNTYLPGYKQKHPLYCEKCDQIDHFLTDDDEPWCIYRERMDRELQRKTQQPNKGFILTCTLDQSKGSPQQFKKHIQKKLNSTALQSCEKVWYVFEHLDTNIHAHVWIKGNVRTEWFRTLPKFGHVNKQIQKGSEEQITKYFSKENEIIKIKN